jgi:hypothetical protein
MEPNNSAADPDPLSDNNDYITSFKSRFLKTDRSAALRQDEVTNSTTSRSVRSTFSPLARLPENAEVKNKPPTSGVDDNLSKNIKDFINRTDHISNEWQNVGQKRSSSVERGTESSDYSWSAKPLSLRASSVAPNLSRDPYDRSILPPNHFMMRRDPISGAAFYRGDNDFTSTFSVRSVTHSVTGRASALNGTNGNGVSRGAPPPMPNQRFMSLEEECNWILSGREPLTLDGNRSDDDDDEDNTLDDISGDEVWVVVFLDESVTRAVSFFKVGIFAALLIFDILIMWWSYGLILIVGYFLCYPREKFGHFLMNQLFFLQLSEMAADLAEEHSTATLATERLEAEQSERMRLEKDRGDLEVYPVLMNLIYQLIIKLLNYKIT